MSARDHLKRPRLPSDEEEALFEMMRRTRAAEERLRREIQARDAEATRLVVEAYNRYPSAGAGASAPVSRPSAGAGASAPVSRQRRSTRNKLSELNNAVVNGLDRVPRRIPSAGGTYVRGAGVKSGIVRLQGPVDHAVYVHVTGGIRYVYNANDCKDWKNDVLGCDDGAQYMTGQNVVRVLMDRSTSMHVIPKEYLLAGQGVCALFADCYQRYVREGLDARKSIDVINRELVTMDGLEFVKLFYDVEPIVKSKI
jgi:hypothetical protein